MKFLNIKLLALVAFLSIGSNACAYSWGFSNHTKKTLVIRQGLAGYAHWNYNIVKPGKRVVFNYDGQWAGYCMHSFAWAEYNPNLKVPGVTENGGLDMYENIQRIWPTLGLIGREFGNVGYQYTDGDLIFMPDELYADTVKYASGIGSGFDTFLCNAVILTKILNKGTCMSPFRDIINWIGGLIARSSCKSREITIFQDRKTGEITFTTLLN